MGPLQHRVLLLVSDTTIDYDSIKYIIFSNCFVGTLAKSTPHAVQSTFHTVHVTNSDGERFSVLFSLPLNRVSLPCRCLKKPEIGSRRSPLKKDEKVWDRCTHSVARGKKFVHTCMLGVCCGGVVVCGREVARTRSDATVPARWEGAIFLS